MKAKLFSFCIARAHLLLPLLQGKIVNGIADDALSLAGCREVSELFGLVRNWLGWRLESKALQHAALSSTSCSITAVACIATTRSLLFPAHPCGRPFLTTSDGSSLFCCWSRLHSFLDCHCDCVTDQVCANLSHAHPLQREENVRRLPPHHQWHCRRACETHD